MNERKIAQIITDISTPAIVGTVFLIYALFRLSDSDGMFFKIISIMLILVIVLPSAFTYYLVRKGVVTNFHLKIKKDRLYPLLFALASGLAAILAIKFVGATDEVNKIMLLFYVMALGFSVITFKYKISGHAFVFTSAVVMAATFLDSRFIVLLLLLFPIGWSRLYLKEHTLKELLLGTTYALLSFYILNLLI